MKNKVRQMFRDKLFLVMLVLGLLTIVAAAGVVTIQRGGGTKEEAGQLAGASEMEQAAQEEDNGSGGRDFGGSGEDSAARQADTADGSTGQGKTETEAAPAGAGNDAAAARMLNFSDADRLGWPVRGSVLIDYSMDATTYFATLEQYKCSPGIVLQSEVSTPVYAPAAARVLEVGSNEELGNYVTLDLGNDYTAICGQLKEIPVAVNDYVDEGSLLGYVAEPTKYYSVEGPNVYFELTCGGSPVDPLDYME